MYNTKYSLDVFSDQQKIIFVSMLVLIYTVLITKERMEAIDLRGQIYT